MTLKESVDGFMQEYQAYVDYINNQNKENGEAETGIAKEGDDLPGGIEQKKRDKAYLSLLKKNYRNMRKAKW